MEKSISTDDLWYKVTNIKDVSSPSLMVYPERIVKNIQKMIALAGSTEQLRPHVKTHKMPEIVQLQMKKGINKFKCATISEAEMVAKCGAKDILLAMQPVGPNLERFFNLKREFINSKISCIADNEEVVIQLSDLARRTRMETHIWLDINNGMNRTGIIPGEKAARLYRRIFDSPMLIAEGLHVYDGHIHEPDFQKRQRICNDAFLPVMNVVRDLRNDGIGPIKIVAGGTPTFPIHALREGVESSPGTIILWDYGYSSSFTDMDFLHAAILLMRVVSKPAPDLLCLDLGHKAVASEMVQPRVKILGMNDYVITNHNEEHMVIRTRQAGNYKTGDELYGIPWHICPTVDRHDTVTVINNNTAVDQWTVEARKRKITI